jgi:hypothetical protein
MHAKQIYPGIHNDVNGGMTTIGKMIRDAWVFELIPESETCEGWNSGRIEVLLHQVNAEWDKYGCLVSHLPEELGQRHKRIHTQALAEAKQAGWCGEQETDADL